MGKHTVSFEVDYAGKVSKLVTNIESLSGVTKAVTSDASANEEVDMKLTFDVTFDRNQTDEKEVQRGIEGIHRVWEANL